MNALPQADKFAPLSEAELSRSATIARLAPAPEWTPIVPVPQGVKLPGFLIKSCCPPGCVFDKQWWFYKTPDGGFSSVIIRYNAAEGDGKEFRPFTYCRNAAGKCEWRCQGLPEPRPLYGLDRLAATPNVPVIICEGEKSADAAAAIFPNHVAMTSSGGAKAFDKADWKPLAGRDVVIWPDHDKPGAKYAEGAAGLANAAGARSVRIVAVPDAFPHKWDLADSVPEGADLTALFAAAKPFVAMAENTRDPGTVASVATVAGTLIEPLPLFPPIAVAEPYPVDALGATLSRAAKAIESTVQVPVALASQSVLAVASLAACNHADVMLPYGQSRPLALFFASVLESGGRKSTADNEALWPVHKREKELRDLHDEEIKEWKHSYGAWSAEKRKIEADRKCDLAERKNRLIALGDEPERPLFPFLVTGDLTIEGLTKNWSNAHAALGIFTAEGGTFTAGHGMNDDNRLKTAAMLSELWDGKPVKRVRALDGVTILPGRRLALHIMIQPDAAVSFLCNNTLRDQGLLSRILVAAPASVAGSRAYQEPCPQASATIRAYGARILSLLEVEPALEPGKRNELKPRALPLSAAATAIWREFYNHIESQCGSGDGLEGIGDFAAKAAEHAARIAGVITIIEDLHAKEIGLVAMEGGIELANWYVGEADRLKSAGRTNPKLLRAEKLLKWLQGQPGCKAGFREIIQLGPHAMRTKASIEEALVILADHGWTREVSTRPRIIKAEEQ